MGGFSYPDEFIYEADLIPEMVGAGAAGVLLAVYLLFLFIAAAFSLACYVFYSLGLYAIASRRGIRHSWLAWLPIGNIWILGNISDQYQYLAKGKIKNRRKLLMGLNIGPFAILAGWFVAMLVSAMTSKELATGVIVVFLVAVLGYFIILALAIVLTVFQYIGLYDLYNSCNPNNGILFLVLSIIFPVAMPFFVFACRKKDLGMPPRKQPAPQPVIETVQEESNQEPVTEEGFAQPEEFEEE